MGPMDMSNLPGKILPAEQEIYHKDIETQRKISFKNSVPLCLCGLIPFDHEGFVRVREERTL